MQNNKNTPYVYDYLNKPFKAMNSESGIGLFLVLNPEESLSLKICIGQVMIGIPNLVR